MGSLIEFEKDNFKFTVVFGECCVIKCTTQNIQSSVTEQYQTIYNKTTLQHKYCISNYKLKQLFKKVENNEIKIITYFKVINGTRYVLLKLKFREPCKTIISESFEVTLEFTLSFLDNLSNANITANYNDTKILILKATVEKLNDKIDGLTSTISIMLSKIIELETKAHNLAISTNRIDMKINKMQNNAYCKDLFNDAFKSTKT